jgi:prolyl-tRNA synthetase
MMKDSYSFDRDPAGLQRSYELHIEAYDRIFERTGLRWYRVAGDVGMMGGTGAHEYMAPCAAGENEVALAPGYAANVEVASAQAQAVELPAALEAPQEVHTPGATTIAAVAGQLGLPAGALLKAFPVEVEGRGLVMVMVRGDHRVNELKLGAALRAPWRAASAQEIAERIGPPGFIGPVGAPLTVLLDEGVADGSYVVGANHTDTHLQGVQPGRDFAYERVDVRSVEAGDLVGGQPITIEPAIEVANIFQLGTRYSEVTGASYLDEQGAEQLIWMGCYGIGMARIAAAAVEQYSDEHGISWPAAIAPFQLHLVALGKPDSAERALADAVYQTLRDGGVDVLYDDREAGAGEKFADAELLGAPLRLTVGRKALESGEIEVQLRRGREAQAGVAPADVLARVAELCRVAP